MKIDILSRGKSTAVTVTSEQALREAIVSAVKEPVILGYIDMLNGLPVEQSQIVFANLQQIEASIRKNEVLNGSNTRESGSVHTSKINADYVKSGEVTLSNFKTRLFNKPFIGDGAALYQCEKLSEKKYLNLCEVIKCDPLLGYYVGRSD